MRGGLVAVCAIAVALLLAPAAVASHEPGGAPLDEDFAVGNFSIRQSIMDCCTVSLDAHSGPAGQNPSGGTFLSERAFSVTGTITCLTVTGNRAVVGGTYDDGFGGFLFEVEDNASTGAPDRMTRDGFFTPGLRHFPRRLPAVPRISICRWSRSRVVVWSSTTQHRRRSLPTSKDQCKKGGWRNFGGRFRNQGQCVAFASSSGTARTLADNSEREELVLAGNVCFGCGEENGQGLHVSMYREPGARSLRGEFRPGPDIVGIPGITHGGAIYGFIAVPVNQAGEAVVTRLEYYPSILSPDPVDPVVTGWTDFGTEFGSYRIALTGTRACPAHTLPTTKDQCKNGRWRNYGDRFKNQGACVSFVTTGGRKKS